MEDGLRWYVEGAARAGRREPRSWRQCCCMLEGRCRSRLLLLADTWCVLRPERFRKIDIGRFLSVVTAAI